MPDRSSALIGRGMERADATFTELSIKFPLFLLAVGFRRILPAPKHQLCSMNVEVAYQCGVLGR